jgi:single-strand DNA-binding protein
MNAVQLIARLTASPEHRQTEKGEVTKMRVAISRPRSRDGADRGADYVDIAVWGAQAAPCATYLAKGRLIGVQGRLHHREWEAEDGSKHSRLQVLADSVEFLDSARNGNSAADEEAPAI